MAVYPSDIQLDVALTATFNCSIHGGPITSVIWRKDMTSLTTNSRAAFPTPTSLQIRQLRRQDAGIYQCFVNRDDISEQASARLLIGGKTMFLFLN